MKPFLSLCLLSSAFIHAATYTTTALAQGSAEQSYLAAYTDHAEMLKELRQLRVKTQEIGKSRAGKSIMAVQFGDDDAPALLVVGNVDGDYLVGTELAMRLIRDLDSEAIDRHGKTIYVIPMPNPDATDFILARGGYATPYNSYETDDDHDLKINEDGPNDLNQDGIISQLRIADATGPYKANEDNPDLLEKADLLKNVTGAYRLITEGKDDDGDDLLDEDGYGGVNINKNFTYNYDYFGEGAGENQASEPETRALIDFVIDRRNILVTVNFSQYDNLHKNWDANKMEVEDYPRPLRAFDKMPKEDSDAYQLFSHLWKDDHKDWKVSALNRGQGAFHDWAYFHGGRWSIATNGWNYTQIAQAEDTSARDNAEEGAAEGGDKEDKKPGGMTGAPPMGGMGGPGGGIDPKNVAQTQARLFADAKAKGLSGAVIEWTPVTHPDFPGEQVEVGGFNTTYLINPDPAVYQDTQSSRYVATLASLFPELQVTQQVERVADNLQRVTLTIKNTGKLPTQSAMGKLSRWMMPVRVEWNLPKERIISGTKRTLLDPIAGHGGELVLKWLINTEGERQASYEITSPVTNTVSDTVTFGG